MAIKKNDIIMASHIYPIGSIYESIEDINPETIFGGTWEQIYADYQKTLLSSQLVYPERTFELSPNSQNNFALQGAYTWGGFLGLQHNIDCPPNHKLKYAYSLEYSTEYDLKCFIKINGTDIIGSFTTWSGETFREEWLSGLIEFGVDIIPKSTTDIGYTSDGYVYTLFAINNGTSTYSCHIYGLTQHLYAVSNDKIYRWRRIS